MRVQQVFHLHNAHTLTVAEEIFSLIGGFELTDEQRKPFGRVRGNAFSMADVAAIGAIVRERTAAPVAEAFGDAKLQGSYADGVLATQALARRKFGEFVHALRLELEEREPEDPFDMLSPQQLDGELERLGDALTGQAPSTGAAA